MRFVLAALTLSLGLIPPVSAQEPKRQLGKHEHGRGFLNIAIEGQRLSIELQAPGSDIARSETKPDTPERKAAVAAAIATLEKPLELFKLPADAGCRLVSAKAHMTIIGEGDHHGHGEKKSHGHGHDKQAKHGSHGHKSGDDHRGHSDYHGAYQLACTAPSQLVSVELTYFNTFPRAHKLTIQMIGPKGQTQAEATKAQPIVKLGGII
jgi:hypothetical protein